MAAGFSILETLHDLPVSHPGVVLVFFSLLGLCCGSFANVLIYRLPRQCLSIARPGSFCPACENPIEWYDNIPLLSWALWLGGRCRKCEVAIPLRYPLVELLTGVAFALMAWRVLISPAAWEPPAYIDGWQPWWLMALWCGAFVALLAASAIDLEMRIIPDSISLGGAVVVLAISPFLPALHSVGVPPVLIPEPLLGAPTWLPWQRSLWSSFLTMAVAAGVLWAIGLVGKLVFRKASAEAGGAMGLGDVKYIALLAGLLGWPKLLVAFVVAVFAGALWGMPTLLRKWFTKANPDTSFPFGPILSFGTVVAMLFSGPLLEAVDWYIASAAGRPHP